MAVKCIDIADDKKIQSSSPIAMGVFVALFFVINIFVRMGIGYILCIFAAYMFSHLLFHYSPRYAVLGLKFMFVQPILSPNFEDDYCPPHEIAPLSGIKEESQGDPNEHWS